MDPPVQEGGVKKPPKALKKPVIRSKKKAAVTKRRQAAKQKALTKKRIVKQKVALSKKGVAVAARARRPTKIVTKRVKQTATGKAAIVRTKTLSIKSKARATASKVSSDLRTKLKSKSVANKAQARVAVRTKLQKIQGARSDKLVGSKRARASSAAGNASGKHANAKAGHDMSSKRGADATGKRARAKDDMDTANAKASNVNKASNNNAATRGGVDNGRQGAARNRDAAKDKANTAAGNAEGQRVNGNRTRDDINTNKANHAARDSNIHGKRDGVNKKRAGASDAAASAQRHKGTSEATSGTAGRRQADQGGHKNARDRAGGDVQQHKTGRDAANARKTANEGALTGAQAKHADDMSKMKANADGTVNTAGGRLNDANTAGAKHKATVDGVSGKRPAKQADAAKNRADISTANGNLTTARGHEGAAKARRDAASVTTAGHKNTLNGLGAKKPGLEAGRNSSKAAADKAAPKRNDADAVSANRKDKVNDTDIPNAKNAKAKAGADRDAATSAVGNNKGKKAANDAELDGIKNRKAGHADADTNLRARKNNETAAMNGHVGKRDAATNTAAGKQDGMHRTAEHGDQINSLIKAKSAAGPQVSRAQNDHIVSAQRATATDGMATGGKVHAISSKNSANTRSNINARKGRLDTHTGEVGALKGKRGGAAKNRDTEAGNTAGHDTSRASAGGRAKGRKAAADDAAGKAGSERAAGQRVGDGRQAKQGDHKALNDQLSGKHGSARGKRGAAEAEGGNARGHRAKHDAAADNGVKAKNKRDGADADRAGNAGKAKAHSDAHKAALKRKSDAENARSKHQADHADTMNNMRRDPQGAAKKHGKDLDDMRGSAGNLGNRANAARGKRGGAEGAAGGNASTINGKRGELSAAQGHEGAARRKYDADSAANPARKKALDKREAEISGLRRARDSSNPEGARPQRRPQDDAMRSRKGDIYGQVPRHKKAKDDAADAVNANRQKAADLNAKKKGLPKEDGSDLHLKDASLNRKGAKEKAYNNELRTGKKKVSDNISKGRQSNLASMMIADKLGSLMQNLLIDTANKALNPAGIIGPGITENPNFTYPGSTDAPTSVPGGTKTDAGTGSTDVITISADKIGKDKSPDYASGYNAGKVAGAKDGQRDGTADAITPNEEDSVALEAQLKILETNDNAVIEQQITIATNNAYCKEVEKQGLAEGIDIHAQYPECEDSFAQNVQEGGYMEDAEGVMQFGGALTSDPEPSEEYDAGYTAGYQNGYKAAYPQAYSLTIAIRKTNRVVTPPPGYGDLAAAAIKATAPTTEAAAIGPSKNGASGAASGAQAGGALKQAKRKYKRGKTFMQHSNLIDKIRGKTIVV